MPSQPRPWHFELVAGPFEGQAGGVVWETAHGQILFSAIDEGRLLRFNHTSKEITEFRRYANRVNGLALGPNGEVYGAQEGGRRLVQFTPDGRTVPVDALLDGKYHNQPSDLVVDRQGRHLISQILVIRSSHSGRRFSRFSTIAPCCVLSAMTAEPGSRPG